MQNITREEFLAAVFATAKEQASGAGHHPEDVMSSVLTTAETLHCFFSHLASGVSLGRRD